MTEHDDHLLQVSVGTTLDELAAVAELHGVPFLLELTSAPDQRGDEERRVALDASLRSLVAHRVLVVDEDRPDPEFRLLDPYATAFAAILTPELMVRMQRIGRDEVDTRVLAVREGRLVELVPTYDGVADLVLTPLEDLADRVLGWLGLPGDIPAAAGGPFETTLGALEEIDAALDADDEESARRRAGSAELFDLAYARRVLLQLSFLRAGAEDGALSGEDLTVMDCGDLGLWLVDADERDADGADDEAWRDAPAVVRPLDGGELRSRVAAWLVLG